MSENAETEIVVNGIDAETGEYLLDPLSPETVTALALGEPIDPNHLRDLKAKLWRDTEKHYAPMEGLDPNDLAQVGWGVVFAHDADPALREALRPLLEFRKGQAGRTKERFYREFVADMGYRAGDPKENKRAFLARNGAAAGQPADPDKVPYYLLLVGDPATIPYRFQYQLDVEYAVGRLWFEEDGKPDLEAFARYARGVVESESGGLRLPRRAAFVGVQNDADRATRLSANDLVKPLAEVLASRVPGWEIRTHLDDEATKDRFARLLGGDETPTFLFTASHGVGFSNGHPRQLAHQGALLCQDWPGPDRWRQPIGPDFYFAADDVSADARLLGLIAFHFACYGAGTPDLDDFAHLKNLPRRSAIAPRPFAARLPQRLLSSPKGGALAVIGHVERAWGCSFYGRGRAGRQLQTFQSTLMRLLDGQRVGWALEYFNQLYAALSTDLSEGLEDIKYGKVPDVLELSEMWTANNDARSFVVCGDPAVRLPPATEGQPPAERPALSPLVFAPRPGPAAGGTPSAAAPAPTPDPLVAMAPESSPPPPTPPAQETKQSPPPAAPASGAGDAPGGGAAFGAQLAAAEERYRRREAVRESVSYAAGVPGLLQHNDADRVRARLRGIGLQPGEIEAVLESGTPSYALIPDAEAPAGPRAAVAVQLERILGRNDMVGARFLEAGARAARPVGRVRIRAASRRAIGFGTGSLIGPGLLMTNHHVLARAETARASVVEFNAEEDFDGRPLTPEVFDLAPDVFFLTDPALDFTIVAVAPVATTGGGLDAYGWNRGREGDDPILVEEFVNIIQHPQGRPKQVALRDNQVIDLLEEFLHYRADTEPGSSGAPVFNDQWELVGLHHSGVPRRAPDGTILARGGVPWTVGMDEREIDWIANEGVRLSRVLARLKAVALEGEARRLRDALFSAEPGSSPRPRRRRPGPGPGGPETAPAGAVPPAATAVAPWTASPPSMPAPAAATVAGGGPGPIRLTIPLQIEVEVRVVSPGLAGPAPAAAAPPPVPVPVPAPAVDFGEAVSIDPDYGTRRGYDPEFLGKGARRVELPKLSPALAAAAARPSGRARGLPYELKYHHYSVVMHRARRLAIFTAVNIEGDRKVDQTREADKWLRDPRIDRDAQVGNEFYKGTPFDRGHLVRRIDPAWGPDSRVVKVANDDTFHFTNCAPQHKKFNRGLDLWRGLEDFLLDRAVEDRKRVIVFTGPVFDRDDDLDVSPDPDYAGVKVPRWYWKVAVVARPGGKLGALGFLVSQSDLADQAVANLRAEETAVDVAATFQVPVARVGELTGLDFGPLARLEAPTVAGFGREAAAVRELESLDDIVFPGDEAGAPSAPTCEGDGTD